MFIQEVAKLCPGMNIIFDKWKANIFTETRAGRQESSCKRRREAPSINDIIIRSCYLGKYHLRSEISSSEEWSAKYHIWSEISSSDLVFCRLRKSSAVGVFVPPMMCVADAFSKMIPQKNNSLWAITSNGMMGRCFCIAWLILSQSYQYHLLHCIGYMFLDWLILIGY